MEDIIIKNMDLNYTPPEEIQVEMDVEEKVKVLNQDSTIAIIGKTVASEEELNFIYHKYSLLPKIFKRISNQYSIQLFGYNVPNMYAIMRSKFIDNDYIFNDRELEPLSKTLDEINTAVIEGDMKALSSLEEQDLGLSPRDKAELDYELNEAKNEILENSVYNFSDFTMVPWFTPSEEYYKLEHFEDPDYARKVINAMNVYGMNPTLENCSKVLDLGWNPEVKVTKESIEYAKKRQSEWLNEHKAIIYDISDRDIPINETSSFMKKFYKDNDIYPVYIVLSWTNTTFGKLIKFVKNSKYSHAGLSLNSDLREIVTFKYDSVSNGFAIENLKEYMNTYRDCQIEVLCLFVDKRTFEGIEKSVKFYKENKSKTVYAFKNLFSVLLSKSKTFTPYDKEMICSQFVDHILRLNNISITNKANNLVIPQDYVTIANNNPRVYKVFEGFGKDYYDGKVEANIKDLLNSRTRNTVLYKEELDYDLYNYQSIPVELAVYSISK